MRRLLLEYRGLEVTFELRGLRVYALRGVDLEVQGGEVLGVMGESGSGKTVLLHATLRLLPEYAKVKGRILYKGLDLLGMSERSFKKILGRSFSLIPQGFASLNPCLVNWIQVSERPMEHFGKTRREGYEVAAALLEKLGIADPRRVAKGYRHQLSGGILQRVLVAMGTSAHSEVLFVDEPTKGLDRRMKRLLVELLSSSRGSFDSMVVVSHDLDFLREVSDRICVLYCGEVVEVRSKADFFKNPRHPYSMALLASLPSRGLSPIPGEPPDMTSPPPGCSFHPRCSSVSPLCRSLRPPLLSVGGGMVRCHLYGRGP
ncbi:MAG: ABC transporter ATP-binding protein [Candidatus Nezhaarchaeota archaeon]|nr:ABC transporter ATP-binding protein [Candidatus Nezhaarchaeota archaeon]